MRIAIVLNPFVYAGSTLSFTLTTKVNAPGKNLAAIFSILSSTKATCFICSTFETIIGMGFVSGRCFARFNRSKSSKLPYFTPTPYTVSVGKAIILCSLNAHTTSCT